MKSWGWTILTVAAAIMLGIALSNKPWQEAKAQKVMRAEAMADVRRAEDVKAELTADEARLSSPYGMEEVARSRGYRRAHEQPVVLSK